MFLLRIIASAIFLFTLTFHSFAGEEVMYCSSAEDTETKEVPPLAKVVISGEFIELSFAGVDSKDEAFMKLNIESKGDEGEITTYNVSLGRHKFKSGVWIAPMEVKAGAIPVYYVKFHITDTIIWRLFCSHPW